MMAITTPPRVLPVCYKDVENHLVETRKVTLRTANYDIPCYLLKLDMQFGITRIVTNFEMTLRSAGTPVKRRVKK